MGNSSFQYWDHREKVRRIAGVEEGEITPVLWSNDVPISLPAVTPTLILQYRVPNNQAFVITRFEAGIYLSSSLFPVVGGFDYGFIFEFITVKVGTVGSNPGQVRFAGFGNAIANTVPVFLFNSGEIAELDVLDPNGPRNINVVATCYAWLIPGGKAGNFQNYLTIQATS